MRFELLQPDDPLNYQINANGPAIDFGAGRNAFLAFELPKAKERGLVVKSWFNTSFVGPHSDPIAIYLNSEKTIVGTDPIDVQYQRYAPVMFGEGKEDSHMLGLVSIPPEVHYVILTTIPANTDAPLRVKGNSGGYRISNPQVHRKIPGHWQKLKPVSSGSMQITILAG